MDPETFSATVEALLSRQPFHPFTVELNNGTRLEVDHPRALAFTDALVVRVGPRNVPTFFMTGAVTNVVGDLAGAESAGADAS